MTWTPRDLPDLTGRTVVVTGANTGIGLHAARELAARGAEVVLACRNEAAGRAAAASLQGAGIQGSARVERLDLASLASVRAFVARWQGRLDLLIDNAGVMRPPRWGATEDGFETQLGVNHLGHVALTAGLLPALLEAPAPRVVLVSSLAHHAGDDSVLAGNPASSYDPSHAYGNSKLANLLVARELQRRAAAAGSALTSVACHPGIAATELFARAEGLGAHPVSRAVLTVAMPVLFQSSAAGAVPTLYAATAAEPGAYVGPQRLRETRGPVGPARLSRWAADPRLQSDVLDQALQLTGSDLAL